MANAAVDAVAADIAKTHMANFDRRSSESSEPNELKSPNYKRRGSGAGTKLLPQPFQRDAPKPATESPPKTSPSPPPQASASADLPRDGPSKAERAAAAAASAAAAGEASGSADKGGGNGGEKGSKSAFNRNGPVEAVALQSDWQFWNVFSDMRTIGKGHFAKVKQVVLSRPAISKVAPPSWNGKGKIEHGGGHRTWQHSAISRLGLLMVGSMDGRRATAAEAPVEPMEQRRTHSEGAIHRIRAHHRNSPYNSPTASPTSRGALHPKAEAPLPSPLPTAPKPKAFTDCAICQEPFTDPAVGGGW
mgnify:CR=1 FL=1